MFYHDVYNCDSVHILYSICWFLFAVEPSFRFWLPDEYFLHMYFYVEPERSDFDQLDRFFATKLSDLSRRIGRTLVDPSGASSSKGKAPDKS